MTTQTSTQADVLQTTGKGAVRAARLTDRVYDDAGADIVNGEVALGLLGISRGDSHPTYTDLRAATYEVAQVLGAGSGRMYDITWQFLPAPLVPTGDGRDDLVPGADQLARINLSVRTIWVDCWRVFGTDPPFVDPPSGATDDPPSNDSTATVIRDSDIGGNPIDSGGKAVSCAVTQSVLDVRQTLQQRVPFGNLTSKVGRRNSQTAFGSGIGTLLFLGADAVERDTGAFDYVWHFAWDQYNHARQQVLRESTGQPKLGGSVDSTDVIYKDKGYSVYWVQPYPELVSFSGLGINLP